MTLNTDSRYSLNGHDDGWYVLFLLGIIFCLTIQSASVELLLGLSSVEPLRQVIHGDGVSIQLKNFFCGYSLTFPGFYINLPLGLFVVIPLILLRIPEQTPKDPPKAILFSLHQRLDLVGFVVLASFSIELLLALQYGGNKFPWRSSQVIGLFCGAATTFVAWLTWNWRRGKDALLSFPVISRRHVWMSGLCYSAVMVAVYGVSYFLPIYFQAIKGVNAVMSGVYLLPSILPQVVASASSGILGKIRCRTDVLLFKV